MIRLDNIVRHKYLIKNPYLIFLPFLGVYLTIALLFHNDSFVGDENRYLILTENILKWDFSPHLGISLLSNGPGYPLLISPILALKLPHVSISIVNAFLYYFSIVLLYKSLNKIIKPKLALLVSLFWALYYNIYENIPLTLTEIFTVYLVSLLIFSTTKTFFEKNSKKSHLYLVLSGITFGYLALTKFIFGYVLLVMLIASFTLWITNRTSDNYKKGLFILLIGFVVNIPYLTYSYNQTGNMFAWGSVTADNLYWMTSPYEGEYGDWHSFKHLYLESDSYCNNEDSSLINNHSSVYLQISGENGDVNNELLKEIAVENIKNHPVKYIQNCMSNLGRIIFNYPYSYAKQNPRTLLRLPLNGIICVLLLFVSIPTFLNWQKIPYPNRFLLMFGLIYLGGCVLVSSETRMFSIIVPILLLYISYLLQQTVKVKVKFKLKEEN